MLKATIHGLALDVASKSPVVILAAEGTDKVLPIWIGHFEAWAIAMEIDFALLIPGHGPQRLPFDSRTLGIDEE